MWSVWSVWSVWWQQAAEGWEHVVLVCEEVGEGGHAVEACTHEQKVPERVCV